MRTFSLSSTPMESWMISITISFPLNYHEIQWISLSLSLCIIIFVIIPESNSYAYLDYNITVLEGKVLQESSWIHVLIQCLLHSHGILNKERKKCKIFYSFSHLPTCYRELIILNSLPSKLQASDLRKLNFNMITEKYYMKIQLNSSVILLS